MKAEISADLPANAVGFIAAFPRRAGNFAVYHRDGSLSNVLPSEAQAREAASSVFDVTPTGYLVPRA